MTTPIRPLSLSLAFFLLVAPLLCAQGHDWGMEGGDGQIKFFLEK